MILVLKFRPKIERNHLAAFIRLRVFVYQNDVAPRFIKSPVDFFEPESVPALLQFLQKSFPEFRSFKFDFAEFLVKPKPFLVITGYRYGVAGFPVFIVIGASSVPGSENIPKQDRPFFPCTCFKYPKDSLAFKYR